MWIILLDSSSSMADPFEGGSEFAGRQRETAARTKIDAAREALVQHLQGLGAATEARVFAFRDAAELIYSGTTGDIGAIKGVLDSVQASGGTDVAAALAAALAEVEANASRPVIRVLLISDGLSDPPAAWAASERLLARRVPVDVALIDPTPQGQVLARSVAGEFGIVTAVTSQAEIGEAVERAMNAMRADTAAARHADVSLAQAIKEFSAGAIEDNVSFTAAHPSEIARDSWGSLLVYIHLSSLTEEARERLLGAGKAKGAQALSQTVRAATRLARGTELTLTPRLSGFDVNPPSLVLTWEENIQSCDFRIRPRQAAEGPVTGEVEIVARGLTIGRIALALTVRGAQAKRPGDLEPKLAPGGLFAKIFASYAREDENIVEACKAAYAGLGIYLIVDKQALSGGQVWRSAIRALLAGADAFQLFWSKPASVSPPVQEEILDACVVEGERGLGYIRPVYWDTPPPPLPPALAHLNFAFLDVGRLAVAQATGAVPPPGGRDTPLEGAPDIPVAVLPLLPSVSAGLLHLLREDVAFAIVFVERTVGTRYYPVPTLLVDRHTVESVRRDQTTDFGGRELEAIRELADWGEVLSSICLALHVSEFWPERNRELALATARRAGLTENAFRMFSRRCEGGPGIWFIASWLAHPDDKILGLAEATELRGAVAAIVAATLAQAGDPSEMQRSDRYGLDNWWPDWRRELEDAGVAFGRGGYNKELSGTRAAFRAGMERLGAYIDDQLVAVGGRYEERREQEVRLRAALHLATGLGARLLGRSQFDSFDLARLALRELEPEQSWTGARDALSAAGLPGVASGEDFLTFADSFFGAASKVLRQLQRDSGDAWVKNCYDMPLTVWRRLSSVGLATRFKANANSDGQKISAEGPVGAFADVLEAAWKRARELVRNDVRAPLARFAIAQAPTYGIFAPADAVAADAQVFARAAEWGVPPTLCLTGADRVLLCASAIDDFQSFLHGQGRTPNLGRMFARGVLVHEHFHAFAHTAPMADGTSPPGPRMTALWRDAAPVNEALAA